MKNFFRMMKYIRAEIFLSIQVKNSKDNSLILIVLEPSSNKEDTLIIEYSPKIFNHLRKKIDEISHEIIEK